jgi:hypothetical protein
MPWVQRVLCWQQGHNWTPGTQGQDVGGDWWYVCLVPFHIPPSGLQWCLQTVLNPAEHSDPCSTPILC